MDWTTIVPSTKPIPTTGHVWVDFILGALIPIGIGLIYLIVKWLRTYIKNKIKEQELKEVKLTKEIEIHKKN